MKVRDLMEFLDGCDPDATVLFVSQPGWPFENSIGGMTTRADVERQERADRGDDEEDQPPNARGVPDDQDRTATGFHGEVAKGNDVFLVEGRQVRHGSKAAWNCR